jgi:ABC-type Co2+ transport system permease subunit
LLESNSKPIQGLGRSVLLGGGASGVLSIFPGLNLLNLFLMAWIVLGAGLTIHLLYKKNPSLRRGDALLAGALSGLTGGGIFAVLGFLTVAGLTQEKLDQLVESARAIAPFLAENQDTLMAGGQFKTLMIMAICLFFLLAIAAGAVAGLIARTLLRPAQDESA